MAPWLQNLISTGVILAAYFFTFRYQRNKINFLNDTIDHLKTTTIDNLKTTIAGLEKTNASMEQFFNIFKIEEVKQYVDLVSKRYQEEATTKINTAMREKDSEIEQLRAKFSTVATLAKYSANTIVHLLLLLVSVGRSSLDFIAKYASENMEDGFVKEQLLKIVKEEKQKMKNEAPSYSNSIIRALGLYQVMKLMDQQPTPEAPKTPPDQS